MSGKAEQNSIAEKRNRTLIDIVRNMRSYSSLPLLFWRYALKIAIYILNKVPSKAVPKTSFELWTGKRLSLSHLHVWSCPTEIRIYNPHEKKLDFRTSSEFFIDYPKKSKECKLYYPNHGPRIIETKNTKFIENGEVSRNGESRNKVIQEVRVQNPILLTFKNVVPTIVEQLDNIQEQQINVKTPYNETITNEPIVVESQGITLRKSQ
ncbi:Ribonuclease H-like domain containing protein [Parasponia andersonii]|uniref:Ribonuclease H-like domain containing protein n=1 Tax=Parasponia andersonii TaxID=3476 RepID=A0A2P5DBK1_PARAD|nr:Ribonuclease H-like domain containing protein [Parasponia andersonii]